MLWSWRTRAPSGASQRPCPGTSSDLRFVPFNKLCHVSTVLTEGCHVGQLPPSRSSTISGDPCQSVRVIPSLPRLGVTKRKGKGREGKATATNINKIYQHMFRKIAMTRVTPTISQKVDCRYNGRTTNFTCLCILYSTQWDAELIPAPEHGDVLRTGECLERRNNDLVIRMRPIPRRLSVRCRLTLYIPNSLSLLVDLTTPCQSGRFRVNLFQARRVPLLRIPSKVLQQAQSK
jgi:hypothetical protein